MKMSEDLAKRVIDAFGPCTHVYECTSPKEMVEDADSHDGGLISYLELLIEVEGIKWERHTEANSLGGVYSDEELKQEIENRKWWMKEVRARVMALAYDALVPVVFARLPPLPTEDERFRPLVVEDIKRKLSEGWDLNDIVRYIKCSEHFSPDLEEEYALRTMNQIASKYTRS